MRILRVVAAVLLTAPVMAALAADRDPYSGAPLPPAKHEPASPITDHFYIRAAFYSAKFDTNFRVDPSNAPAGTTGTPVNAENDLGLAHRQHKGRVDFMFRLRERNKVRVDYTRPTAPAARYWQMTSCLAMRPSPPARQR